MQWKFVVTLNNLWRYTLKHLNLLRFLPIVRKKQPSENVSRQKCRLPYIINSAFVALWSYECKLSLCVILFHSVSVSLEFSRYHFHILISSEVFTHFKTNYIHSYWKESVMKNERSIDEHTKNIMFIYNDAVPPISIKCLRTMNDPVQKSIIQNDCHMMQCNS